VRRGQPSALGRPKGSTREKKRLHFDAFRKCINAIKEASVKEASSKKKEERERRRGIWIA
jgi:hypothetical protein